MIGPQEKEILELLTKYEIDENLMKEVQDLPEPRLKYFIAITPRSGSSLLCDLIRKLKVLGEPVEYLSIAFINNGWLKLGISANTPDSFLRNIVKIRKTQNGVAGIKASWFQFKIFYNLLTDKTVLNDFKYIYLTRPDVALQAVSLYKATASSVFHSYSLDDENAVQRIENLEFDFKKIDEWYRHIIAQEEGWRQFFSASNISPLCITYDEITNDWHAVVRKIGEFVGLKAHGLNVIDKRAGEIQSRFKKIGDEKNIEWAKRYRQEKQSASHA